MKKIRAAVVGYGNIGHYALQALQAAPDFEVAGIVRRQGEENKPAELAPYKVVKDIRDLGDVDVALLCTPTRRVEEYAKEIQKIRDRFVELAISYNINIITGSMPFVKEDGGLYNVGFLCRRDGSVDMYEKIHVTPDEQKSWGLSQGNRVQTFDTDCGRIGILICYDVEFPELSRLMAADGMQILFVPFNTDTQNAYARVKICAQARAVENECYVAIAGSVGNLPRVHNMDIQYAQSAVFTPCDFAFPTDGKRAMATPGTEQILVADCDLTLLNELHTYGSVRNLRDRRNDLYELKMK